MVAHQTTGKEVDMTPPTITLENGQTRAVILPSAGATVASLDIAGTPVLMAVRQPVAAGIALRFRRTAQAGSRLGKPVGRFAKNVRPGRNEVLAGPLLSASGRPIRNAPSLPTSAPIHWHPLFSNIYMHYWNVSVPKRPLTSALIRTTFVG